MVRKKSFELIENLKDLSCSSNKPGFLEKGIRCNKIAERRL